ncbi:hypothetical protein NGRA_0893 [Nosema granulosis]|uniref:RRM domain-containing protein n=1 Tax=Nosema granulosis TaxID=83296 RepID=A0A9P6KZ59_9MICR|nr:hypothetical protein NGRA_0893 [Nosema granulosis]
MKMFITKIPKAFNKKLLYELLIQFAPIQDFYFEPSGKFCIVSFRTKKDMFYTKEMLATIKHLRTEISEETTVVEVYNLHPSLESVFKKMMSKFGSVKFRKGCLLFKKKEAAMKAVECCDGKFIGSRKVEFKIKEDI